MTDEVRYERHGAAAVLTIDRPARRNAVDGATADALERAFLDFEADDDARVLVLTGGGDVAFCAGADLTAIETLWPRLESEGGPLGFTRRTATKPTIAAIEGWCLAGGFELALWCDLRIASSEARLGFTERRFGVPLVDGGTQRLPRIVGQGRALDLVLSGRVIDATEAHAMGLLTEVVERGRSRDRAVELAEELAGWPQDTMLADRAALLASFGHPLDDGLALEARSGAVTLRTAQQGAARFAGGEGRGASGVRG